MKRRITLGVVFAPRLLTPADTVGFGGLQLSADLASTTITGDASYWRARAGSSDPSQTGTFDHGASAMSAVGVVARKGAKPKPDAAPAAE